MENITIAINRALTQQLNDAVREKTEEILKEAKTKLDKEIRTIVGSLALNVSDYFSVDRVGADVRITVLHHKDTK